MKIRAHLIALLGILAVLLLVFPTNSDAQQQAKPDKGKSKKALSEGRKLFEQKNYRDASVKFADSVKFDPSNDEAHFYKGYTHYYLKEYNEALSELDTAFQQTGSLKLEEKQKNEKLLMIKRVRAIVQYERKDYSAAMDDIRAVLAVEPQRMEFVRLAAAISLEQKNYDEALVSYQKISAAAPNDGNIKYTLATIYAAKGDYEQQAAFAEAAMSQGTSHFAEAQVLAAEANLRLGKTQQAENQLLGIISANPNNREAYRTLAEVYRQQSRFTDAIDLLRRAIRIYDKDGELYTDIAWYYSLAGRHEDAVQAAQAGIRFSPDKYMAYTNLCRAYNDLNKAELAISACNSALKLQPNDGETNFYLGRANDILNRPDDASKFYKRAVTGLEATTRENPTYSDGFYLLGNAYFADNQLDKAIGAYSKCLSMSPNFARARYNLAMVQLQQRNKSGATEQYNVLMTLDKTLASKLKSEIDKVSDKP